MKKIIYISILVSIMLIGCTKQEVHEIAYEKITASEAKTMMDNETYDMILDVRSLEEYNQGHIEGATLLPVDQIQDQAESIIEDKDAKILVYCRSGNRSKTASKALIDMGYTNVYDFGGIVNWPYERIQK